MGILREIGELMLNAKMPYFLHNFLPSLTLFTGAQTADKTNLLWIDRACAMKRMKRNRKDVINLYVHFSIDPVRILTKIQKSWKQ